MIRTVLALLFLAAADFLGLPWLILWTWITGNPNPMYHLSMGACRIAYGIAGVKVRMEGLENIPIGPCIFTPNHASHLDPLALMPRIPRLISVLMKEDIFRIPVLSTGMRLVPFISVRRHDRESGTASFEACRRSPAPGNPGGDFRRGRPQPRRPAAPFQEGRLRSRDRRGCAHRSGVHHRDASSDGPPETAGFIRARSPFASAMPWMPPSTLPASAPN